MKKYLISGLSIFALVATTSFAVAGSSAKDNAANGNGNHNGFNEPWGNPRGLAQSARNGRVDNGGGNGGEHAGGGGCACGTDEADDTGDPN